MPGFPLQPSVAQKQHPTIAFLRGLNLAANRETPVANYLKSFQIPRDHSLDVFREAVAEFTRIANLSPLSPQQRIQRITFYGSQFGGPHYANDLADSCCQHLPSTPISARELSTFCPFGWHRNPDSSLAYVGPDPAGALDLLLQGPTVIDCGMFCQLSIWFGIRAMLGNKAFNAVFSKAPFYLTQFNYNDVNPAAPHLGNPLYPFFDVLLTGAEAVFLGVYYVPNHPEYSLKHPGGESNGHNCVVIGDKYTIFAPTLSMPRDLPETDVRAYLLDELNRPGDHHDQAKIEIYKQQSSEIDPRSGKSYGVLAAECEAYRGFRVEALPASTGFNRLAFNFKKFQDWLGKMMSPAALLEYSFLAADALTVSRELQAIPHENKHMCFSHFKQETAVAQQMLALAKTFCARVMSGQSACVVLSGKAGVGKTATAACCAQELSSRGKEILWTSEVMTKAWYNQGAGSEPDINKLRQAIRDKLTETNPDVVILDDDNLVSLAGEILLEEYYRWYAEKTERSLFITSNSALSFEGCYGPKLDSYEQPPFPGYASSQFANTVICGGLKDLSLRSAPESPIFSLPDEEKIALLKTASVDEPSMACIVSAEIFASARPSLGSHQFIPAFRNEALSAIMLELKSYSLGSCPTYRMLDPCLQQSLEQVTNGGALF